MRYKLTVVEQLDRALAELRVDHPINNRLALILVDNATELVLHRRCTDHVDGDHFLRRLSPRQRVLARGQFLDGKLKVLDALGDITKQEREFIGIAHHYRNELYHVGLKHDTIVRPIAGCYFNLCCDLFERLKPAWTATSSTDSFGEVLSRYLPEDTASASYTIVDNAVFTKKLRAQLPNSIEPLPESLASSARHAIGEITRSLDFVVSDNPGGHEFAAVLRNIQWHIDLMRALEREGVEGTWMDPGYLEEVQRVRSLIEPTWRQRHTTVPASKWLKRADTIEREPDDLNAMTLFQSVRKDMEYLEDAITIAAIELDKWIQFQIDQARGK